MADIKQRSIDVTINDLDVHNVNTVRVRFGPHYFVEIWREAHGTFFTVGATHHGFRANASEVAGQLEDLVEEIKSSHPDLAF